MKELLWDWDWDETDSISKRELTVGDMLVCKSTFKFNHSYFTGNLIYRIENIYNGWYTVNSCQFRFSPDDKYKIGEQLWDYFNKPSNIK